MNIRSEFAQSYQYLPSKFTMMLLRLLTSRRRRSDVLTTLCLAQSYQCLLSILTITSLRRRRDCVFAKRNTTTATSNYIFRLMKRTGYTWPIYRHIFFERQFLLRSIYFPSGKKCLFLLNRNFFRPVNFQ